MKVDLTLVKRIDECISRGATGCPDSMANKFEISKRLLHLLLGFLKKEFDAPIAYSRLKETYYYTEEWEFYIGDIRKIKSNLLKALLDSLK